MVWGQFPWFSTLQWLLKLTPNFLSPLLIISKKVRYIGPFGFSALNFIKKFCILKSVISSGIATNLAPQTQS
jgi:hypothetical protein